MKKLFTLVLLCVLANIGFGQYSIVNGTISTLNNVPIPSGIYAHLVDVSNPSNIGIINSVAVQSNGSYSISTQQSHGQNVKIFINKYQGFGYIPTNTTPIPPTWLTANELPSNWAYNTDYFTGQEEDNTANGISGKFFLAVALCEDCESNPECCFMGPPTATVNNANFILEESNPCGLPVPSWLSIGYEVYNKSIPANVPKAFVLETCATCTSTSIEISPSNAGTIDQNGFITWANDYFGAVQVKGIYNNSCGFTESIVNLAVVDLAWTGPPSVTICEGSSFDFRSYATSTGFERLRYTLVSQTGTYLGNVSTFPLDPVNTNTTGFYQLEGKLGEIYALSTIKQVTVTPNPAITITPNITSVYSDASNSQFNTNNLSGLTVDWNISPSNAGTISGTGQVNWDENYSGSATIKASYTNSCGTKEKTQLVNVLVPCPAPEITFSSNSPVCVGQPIVFTASNNVQASFTILDPFDTPTLASGLILEISNTTINDAGIYKIRVDYCGKIYEATTLVVLEQAAPSLAITSGQNSLPINSPNETYTTDAPNFYTVTYTISPQNAGTINGVGEVNWDDTYTGQATITASITNSCSTKTVTKIVEISALPASYTLGNTVFFDQNKNGTQDNEEIGIAGLMVKLYQADGITEIASITTDNVGNYIFENLPAGDYKVGVTPNPQYSVSSNDGPNTNADNQIDLDDNGIQNAIGAEAISPLINLSAADGIGDLTVDFGFHMQTPLNAPATISSNSPVCEGQTLVLTVGEADPGIIDYAITGPNGVVNNLTISNVSISQAGTYTITSTNVSDGSPVGENSITVAINPLPPTITFISGATSFPINSPDQTYTTDAPNTFTVTYTISPQNAGTINGGGEVNWEDTFTGQATITASITNSCGTKTANRIVTISAPLPTPENLIVNTPVCEGGTLTLSVENPIDGRQYTLNGPNGAITLTGNTATISNVPLNAAGSYTLKTETILGDFIGDDIKTVVVNPLPAAISFTSGAINIGHDSPNETYSTNAPVGSTVTYGIAPTAAGTISGTGIVDWSATFIGSATITAVNSNACGNTTASRIVTVTEVLPTIACTANILVPIPSVNTTGVATFSQPTFTNGNLSQIAGLLSGASFPLGNTLQTYVVTNSLSSTASCSFDVIVYPETAPIVEDAIVPDAVPDPVTGNYSISSAIFDIQLPDGQIVSGLLITTFPSGAQSITINGITYGPPTAPGFNAQSASFGAALVPWPEGGVVVETNDQGLPLMPIALNPLDGVEQVEIDFVAINGQEQQSPQAATITLNFASTNNVICTTTQSGYGNINHTVCDENGNTVSVGSLMASALRGESKIFGLTSSNRTFTLSPADLSSNIYGMLSGVSNASSKFGLGGASYSVTATWPRVPLTAQGKIANNLFAHSMALHFNLQNSTKLDDVALNSPILHTESTLSCGSGAGSGVIGSFQLPTTVVNFLNTNTMGYGATVAGLFQLNNDALGGKTGLPNLSTLAAAADKINKAFNGCRLIASQPANIQTFGTNISVKEGGNGFDAPAKGGLYMTLIEGDAATGHILGVVDVNNLGQTGFAPILNNGYQIVMGTDPEGSRVPNAPVGYRITSQVVNAPSGGSFAGSQAQKGTGQVEIGTYNPQANARIAAGESYEIEFTLEPSGPLPVRLISFTGKSTKKGNELNWKTSSEQNFSHYEVERSSDAKTFEMIGKVGGAGNTNEKLSYEFVDKYSSSGMVSGANTISNNNDYYYRLKLVDLDGKTEFSKIIYLSKNENTEIKVYPNPATDFIIIENVDSNELNIRVLDELGREIIVQTNSNDRNVKIPVGNISTGTYFIQIQNQKHTIYRKVVVNK